MTIDHTPTNYNLETKKFSKLVNYGWAITRNGKTGADVYGYANHAYGPYNTKYTRQEILDRGRVFRLVDKHGNVCVYGRYLDDKNDISSKPLEEYGYVFGCTTIEYADNVDGNT